MGCTQGVVRIKSAAWVRGRAHGIETRKGVCSGWSGLVHHFSAVHWTTKRGGGGIGPGALNGGITTFAPANRLQMGTV